MRHARLTSALPIGLLALAVILLAYWLQRPGIGGQMPAVAVGAFASGNRPCNSAGLDHNSHRW
jgi:hypothetical protein